MLKKASILIVEDDHLLTLALKNLLAPKGHLFTAPTLEAAQQVLEQHSIQCVLLDLHLGSQNSQKQIAHWKSRFPSLEILILSGQPEIKVALECLRMGALDYLVKPFEPELLLHVVDKALERHKMKSSLEKLEPLIHPLPISFIGQSIQLQGLIEKIRLLRNKTQLNVLILGESGTGKEVVARLLHQQEGTPQRPFVVANMPAIPTNLLESELFGVEKGAFTDAKCSRPGKFELADTGDIFLDEIGDLPLEMQSKILRVLQERQIQRLGSHKTQSLQLRVISATNQPLAEFIQKGKFREDLLYRLGDVVLTLPPLRKRKEDIPFLVEHFLQKHSLGTPTQVSPSALDQLMAYEWPGNIRQLESTVKRALIFSNGSQIDRFEIYDFQNLNGLSISKSEGLSLEAQVQRLERKAFEQALQEHSNNKAKAMKALGLSKATFYRKLQELGLHSSSAQH